MSRLTGIEIENVKRLKALRITPKPGVNIIRGKNEQGKTSALDAIEYLFGGAKTHPPEVIRLGEEHAKVVGETETLIATRRWRRTPDGVKTELEVRAKETGEKLDSPQKILDKMYPAESDPTAFFRMKGPERFDWLKKVVGVDTTLLVRKQKQVFDARTLVNRDLDAAKARLKAMPTDKPPPKVDVAALQAEAGRLHGVKARLVTATSERAAAERRIEDAKQQVAACEAALRAAQKKLDDARAHHAAMDNAVDEAEEAATNVDALIAQAAEQVQKASAVAAAHARWEERERTVQEVARLAHDAEAKTLELEKLRKEEVDLVAGAKFPIDGLGFGDGDVTFKGLPLEQASGAQKIRVGAAVLTARDPKLRFMRIPDGEKLDEDNLHALHEFCEEHDMQCFVEMVGENGPALVVIRDGEAVSPG